MYTINDKHIKSVESFLSEMEDSMVKSKIENLFEDIKPTGRMTTDQMEKFTGYSTHLPAPLQNFPQEFSMAVKNAPTSIEKSDSKIKKDEEKNVDKEEDKAKEKTEVKVKDNTKKEVVKKSTDTKKAK